MINGYVKPMFSVKADVTEYNLLICAKATVLEEMPAFPERESSILAKLKKKRPDNNVENRPLKSPAHTNNSEQAVAAPVVAKVHVPEVDRNTIILILRNFSRQSQIWNYLSLFLLYFLLLIALLVFTFEFSNVSSLNNFSLSQISRISLHS